MVDLSVLYDGLPRVLPFEALEARFMRQALLGLLLLAPTAATLGVQVVGFRMAFFADAISHSTFTGVALGLLLAVDPHLTMPLFALLVGLGIVAVQRRSRLPTDTVTGVFLSAAVAFGLAVVSRERGVARDVPRFLYGDILTLDDRGLLALLVLAAAVLLFQAAAYNRLLYVGVNPTLARAHGVRVAGYQYAHAVLLAVLAVFAVWAVGVLLVTALLVVPAAAARNLARSAGGMFGWALVVGTTSAVAGLLLSAHPAVRTATGATVVLCAAAWFVVSLLVARLRR